MRGRGVVGDGVEEVLPGCEEVGQTAGSAERPGQAGTRHERLSSQDGGLRTLLWNTAGEGEREERGREREREREGRTKRKREG